MRTATAARLPGPRPRCRRAALITVLLGVGVLVAAGGGTASAAPAACTGLSDSVYSRVNPSTQSGLLTTSKQESDDAATRYGYTEDHGVPFAASIAPATGMVAVRRLAKASVGDFIWTANASEARSAVAKYGYTDQGVAFYAATAAGADCISVQRFVKGSKHRFGPTSDRSALLAAGWKEEGVAFYGAAAPTPPPGGGGGGGGTGGDPFTIAVLPDTQTWTMKSTDTRFANATNYLVSQRSALNLQQVIQTGDITNWGWLDPAQYTIASAAMQNLQSASIPYLLTVGNHDTRAVGWDGRAGSRAYGGNAYASNPECPERLGTAECKTKLLVRHTEALNANFTAAQETGIVAQFEPGKIDNEYSTFTAGGRKWLALSLEFCPRTEVVTWAQSVVSSHPDANVIVSTHYLLDKDGTIGQNNQGYGANSPQYLYDNLLLRYPNIKLAFSGHTDSTAYREDTGTGGNKVVTMMLTDLGENVSNAMRLVTIDPTTGVVSSRIYAPNLNQSYPQYDRTSTLSFVS